MRVLVGVDAPILRRGLSETLAAEPDVEVVGWASAPLELVEQVASARPQVVLCWFQSLHASIEVAQAVGGTPVIAVAPVRRDDDLFDALSAGLRGLVEPDCTPAKLLAALQDVAEGGPSYPEGWERRLIARLERVRSVTARTGEDALSLTPRETEVLQLLLEGYSVKQVANRLQIALQTTKNHIHHVMVKTGSASRVELVTWAMRHGFRPTAPAAAASPDSASAVPEPGRAT